MRKKEITAILLSISFQASAADVTGWTEYSTGGETMCADGSPFKYYVRQGTSNTVIFDFMGGGACWDGVTCAPESGVYQRTLPDVLGSWIPESSGIYDHTRDDNPYRDATHVLIPYCTGDIHWGNKDMTYSDDQGHSVEVKHRGAVNAKSAIDDSLNHLNQDFKNVLVSGCSAGAYASIWWSPYIQRKIPHASMVQFSDSGAGVLTDSFRKNGFGNWNIDKYAPSWIPGLNPAETDLSQITMNSLYEKIANYYPQANFSQYNHINDLIQRFFYQVMGGDSATWAYTMKFMNSEIESKTTNFTYYTAPWDGHCILPSTDFFDVKTTSKDQLTFNKWFSSLSKLELPKSEPCLDCVIETNKH